MTIMPFNPVKAIRIEQAQVCAGGKCVLNRVSANVRPGRLVAVIGPNGAGKSMLFRTLTGQARLQSGTILMDGVSLKQWPAKKRSMLVAASPDPGFQADPCELVSRIAGDPRSIRLAAAEQLSHRRYGDLTCPEKRRAQLACALSRALNESGLRYLWLDEPDADLDPARRIRLMLTLREIASRGQLGILCILRHLDLAQAFADEVIVLCDGCVLRQGAPEDVFRANDVLRAAAGFYSSSPTSDRVLR